MSNLVYKIKQKSTNKYLRTYFDGESTSIDFYSDYAEIFEEFPESDIYYLRARGYDLNDFVIESFEMKFEKEISIKLDSKGYLIGGRFSKEK